MPCVSRISAMAAWPSSRSLRFPPRNVNWSAKGAWVHYAKIGFEKYFLAKIRRGESAPFYERFALDLLGWAKVKSS